MSRRYLITAALLMGPAHNLTWAGEVPQSTVEDQSGQSAATTTAIAEPGENLRAQLSAAWRQRSEQVRSLRAKYETAHRRKADRPRPVESNDSAIRPTTENADLSSGDYMTWTTHAEVRMADQRRTFYALTGLRPDSDSGTLKRQDYQDAYDGVVSGMLFLPTEDRKDPSVQTRADDHSEGFVIIRATAPLRWWFSPLDSTISEIDLTAPAWEFDRDLIGDRDVIRMRRTSGEQSRETIVVDPAQGHCIIRRTWEEERDSVFEVTGETVVLYAEGPEGAWRPREWSYSRSNWRDQEPIISERSVIAEWEINLDYATEDFQVRLPKDSEAGAARAMTRTDWDRTHDATVPGETGRRAAPDTAKSPWSSSVYIAVNAAVLLAIGATFWMTYRRR